MLIDSKILAKNKLYILAVSGGPDSLFLLEKMRLAGYNLVVAHINYHKRENSDYDEKIVKNYCQKYSLPCEIYQVQNSEYNSISNFQDRARQIRYNFFQELAAKYQTKYIVAAHHRDDHRETYLLQKQKKSLVEYWGLPARTKYGKCWILRPLLSLDKQQIYQYLIENKIDYATDTTNQLLIYQRNIIRQQLAHLNPEQKAQLDREIEKKNCELKEIKKVVQTAAKRLIICSPGMPGISHSTLKLTKKNEYEPEIYLRLLYFWINRATDGILHQRKKKLLCEVYKQLFISPKANLIIELGNDFQIVKNAGQVRIVAIKIN
ncbi:tRNA(Ile)-lysidine synthase [endosymbiont DhMRE of Dentiscutata heterogama]|uniref:tRNA lysidine(34) synthetase TilS n=1 Tax=endosymbiont DhMRE of Dentiscutata heterogama TaxID=1609546 RepID=UPI000629DA15|nr:tRNA lysidine(34) synthetase TilS [endosymbiont DhMRE of Dentiscutata heterogama]CFW92838.1 tRNA(Ile)-lysidine synthase [endosymbiont DhMRE of Dentiscutata heterogama]